MTFFILRPRINALHTSNSADLFQLHLLIPGQKTLLHERNYIRDLEMLVPLLHLKKEVSKDNLHFRWPNPSIFPLPSAGFTKSCSRAAELLQQGQFNLEMGITEVWCLNPHTLPKLWQFRKKKGVWSPEGWWAPREVHTRDVTERFVLALHQWGAPWATSGQGHSGSGSHTPAAQTCICKKTGSGEIRAEPNQAEPKASTAGQPGSHRKPALGTISSSLETIHF